MRLIGKIGILFGVTLLVVLTGISRANDVRATPATSPCTNLIGKRFVTKNSTITFRHETKNSNVSWICNEGNLLVEARKAAGSKYSYRLHNSDSEHLKQGSEYVKRDGRLILLRMVVQEDTGLDGDNRYWLLDFREDQPQVIGPMGGNDASQNVSVIWNDQSVIVVLDRGNHARTWKPGKRKLVQNGNETVEMNGKQVPILNRDGKSHDGKAVYPAYLYDYKKKEIAEAVIEEDYLPTKILKRSKYSSVTDIRDCWGHRASEQDCQALDKKK